MNMKSNRWTIVFLLCFLGVWNIVHAGGLARIDEMPRRVVNFNREWKYMRGDCNDAARPTFDDKNWECIGLPHSFSIPYFLSKDFYVGYGWYRKEFKLNRKELTKNISLEFDGVFQEAEIFVNGVKAGGHVGGYTGFTVDISSLVKEGSNLVAVRVNNLWKPDVAPRAGEHVFSGGIYRNVRLVMKSAMHIAWYGTFVTTPDLASKCGNSSAVKVDTELCNVQDRGMDYRLLTRIIDPEGNLLASVENSGRLASNERKVVTQLTKPLSVLLLWHPTTPHLYKVESLLYQGGKLQDRMETTFGFRWFEWTADKGFFLNGKRLFFKGVNVHQDQAGWGDAVTESAMRRDVALMKEAGFDLIRGSHYPHAPAFSKACDELGMLFWSEAPFWGIGGFRPDGYWNSSAYPVDEKHAEVFESSALRQLEEMIRIHRNHPSIVVWSMCNEAFFSHPSAMPGVRYLLERMVERSHQLDSTRPAAVGGAQRPLGVGRIDLIGDIAGYNGDGATLSDFQQPSVASAVSEYGSTTSDRPGAYTPGWGCLSEKEGWKGFPWRSGQAIWCGFDHGSIAGSRLGKMGIVDYFRIPKRSWYWYRNEYKQVSPPEWHVQGTPARILLSASQTENVSANGTDDVQLLVSITAADGKYLANSPDVRLSVVSGPGEFPTGRSILFEEHSDIRIQDGQAAIAFRSYYAGTAIVEATSPGLPSARIAITFVGAPLYQAGVTPVTEERPYVRFVTRKNDVVHTFGRNNPTFASSAETRHSAGLAADGNPATYWQAAVTDKASYWMLDTEKGLALRGIEISFPEKRVYRYVIEVSDDNHHWTMVSDKRNAGMDESQVKLSFTAGQMPVHVRFVRVRFEEQSPAAISEVVVTGVIQQ